MSMAYILWILNYVCLVVFVLIGVAFFTLLERKILGYIQIRKGPNKVSLAGILQPFADAVKLFTKGGVVLGEANVVLYLLSPVVMIIIMMIMWGIYNFLCGGVDFKLGVLFFLCCSSLSVYSLFGCGWASNSKYALLGALRGVAQTISYEVSLALVILGVIMLIMSYNLSDLLKFQELMWFVCVIGPLMGMWFVSMLAETNRTPFDFAEGESELVSGFNVEYSGGLFALMFMSEYGSIMFMSYFMGLIYFGGGVFGGSVVGALVVVLFIWTRGTLPRFRYDKLMYLAWKSYLPVILNYLVFLNGFMLMLIWF